MCSAKHARLPWPALCVVVGQVARDTRLIVSAVRGALASLLPGSSAGDVSAGGLQGPLGIAQVGAQLASTDALRLLEFGAVLRYAVPLGNKQYTITNNTI